MTIWEKLCEYPAILVVCFDVLQVKLMPFLCDEAYTQDMVRFFSHFWMSKMTEPLFPPHLGQGRGKDGKERRGPVSNLAFPPRYIPAFAHQYENSQRFELGPQVGDQEWVRGNAALRVSDTFLPLVLSQLLNPIILCAGIGRDWTSGACHPRP